jgi:hypothetical protein
LRSHHVHAEDRPATHAVSPLLSQRLVAAAVRCNSKAIDSLWGFMLYTTKQVDTRLACRSRGDRYGGVRSIFERCVGLVPAGAI